MAVSSNFMLNSTYLEFLAPLVKWKLLDHKGLMEEAKFPFHYSYLQRLTHRSEKQGILKSIKDPWSRRKFFYLSDVAKSLFGDDASRLKIYDDSLVHDLKVTEIVRELLGLNSFNAANLEHSLDHKATITPDAVISGSRNGHDFTMAFELELTRKSRERYLGKVRQYLNGSYDYVLYLFPSKSIMKSYVREIANEFGNGVFNKFMMFCCESLLTKNVDLKAATGTFRGNEVQLNELFNS